MIKSMTGFGRGEFISPDRKITVELKSVNHRYFDVNIKMPKSLGMFEGEIRTLLKKYITRGKVDVFITYEDYTAGREVLQYNRALAAEYLKYLRQMSEEFGLEDDIRVSTLSRYPDVLKMEELPPDEEAIWSCLREPLETACTMFVNRREEEGKALRSDIREKLLNLEENVKKVEARSPEIIEAYRSKLEAKMHELLEDRQIDDARIASEVIIFADKICNDEETVRLHSHIQAMLKNLDDGNGVGRQMDFLAQEMNREANTILSKSNDLEISNIAIELKTEIEKIREQIQNIE